MKPNRLCNIFLLLLCAATLGAHEQDSAAVVKPPKTDVYQGMTLKLDLGATAVALAASKAQIQHYELAMNWRVIQRLYPTFEIGYAGGKRTQGDTLSYRGQGGFARVGIDINPLKKHPESPHALLVGVRLGTAVQHMTQTLQSPLTNIQSPITNDQSPINMDQVSMVKADCWGEIVAGCQVNVHAGLYMGWMGRVKCLFTRKSPKDAAEQLAIPLYIPGFGNRDNIGWGLSYHIGYHF